MKRTSKEIIKIIKNNKIAVFNNLQKESIAVYSYLINKFQQTDDVSTNEVFKFIFRSFYRIDNAGLTLEFKNEYFKILQEHRNKIEYSNETIFQIATRLDQFQTLRNTKSFQFSFITKLLNTLDVNSPIWDSEVRTVFNFPTIPHIQKKVKTNLEFKVKIAIEQLNYMKVIFKEIEESEDLKEVIKEFDEKYKTQNLSFNKKIDFILWSTGKIIKPKK